MRPTKRTIYVGLALLVFSLALVGSSAICLAAPAFNTPVNSSSGHVANAISLSGKVFSSGVPAVVVTSVDSYADSLTAAVLAKAYSGPLLLTSTSALSADVASELARLHPTKVFLVGLPSAFVSSVKAAVPALTDAASIVVLKGADRYETAALVARAVKSRLGTVSKVIVTPGDSYGAALAASALAAAQGWPLLLTPAAGPFPQSAKDAIADMGVASGLVVGTDLALGVSGFTVSKRIVGATSTSDPDGRYETCAELADYAVAQGWLTYAHLGLVTGEDYPDGEATAAFLARDKGVLLFAKSTGLPAATSGAIKGHATAVVRVDFVGIGWPVFREVKSLSSARVTGLSATNGPVGGGNRLVVTGTALSGATRVRVGKVDVPTANWKVDSSTQLTIASVPAGYGDGPVEVTVFNFWGPSPANTRDLYWYDGDGVLSPGERVVQKAVEYLGVPYLWAGASPTTGFDCSGFCMYVYRQFGVSLPHYSRSQATYGTAVSKANLQPGDLIFFYTPISHVGMYVGGGMMINAPRSGDLVVIEDAFRSSYVTARRMVLSPSSPPPSYTRFEQSDSRLAYTGTWTTSTTTSASGSSFLFANSAGGSVTISFTGTYLGWIAKKSAVYGVAKVTLDDKTPVMVDLYSSSTIYQQKVWNTGTLASGSHTVKIEWTGTKNASASNTNIGLDGLDLIGNLTQATATPPPPPAPTAVRYEQTDSHVAYAGTWATFSGTGPSGGSYLRANTTGASATIAFDGTYLAWIATRGTTLSKAKVSLDGGTAVPVDLAASAVAYQQKVWDTGTLSDGPHTVTISWDATNYAGKYISVDAIDVIGTLTTGSATPTPPPPTPPPAPTTTRYEQKDTHFAFAGGWTASSSDSASGGSFRYANSAGSSATATFNGTFLAWIGKTSPSYGKAAVTVDGNAPLTVDLYSADTKWQQKIWDTGTLAAGAHTVKVEWTGARNASAIGANINIDAFDIAGTLTQAPAVPATRWEQNDSHFVYTGTWTASSSSSASAGSFRYADSAGSSVTVTFVGSHLSWIAKTSPAYGKATVRLDGGAAVVVDLYSAAALWKQTVWETNTLVPGTHTVKIEWTGTKSSAATGTNIGVDAFDVIGVLK
jgi:putative cell wall-binding protein